MVYLRASGIGGCVRRQVYQALGLPYQELAGPKTRRLWAMGKLLEYMVLQESLLVFEAYVPEIVAVLDEHVTITGHPDNVDEELSTVHEVKSMATYPFKQIKKTGIPVQYPQYMWQLAFYVCAGGYDKGRFICIDRSSGEEYAELWRADTLVPYFEAVKARAHAISCLAEREILPRKDPNLPKWACSSEYCGAINCEHIVRNGK